MDIEIEKRGPVFDGRADRAYHDWLRASDDELGSQAEQLWRHNLNEVIRVNRHVYTSTLHARQDGPLQHLVTDSGHPAVYGPWLEGTGSRNRTTRFKGYFQLRRTAQLLQDRAGGIVERVLQRYIGRMD